MVRRVVAILATCLWLVIITGIAVEYYQDKETNLQKFPTHGIVVDTFHTVKTTGGFATGLALGGPSMAVAMSSWGASSCAIGVSVEETIVRYYGSHLCMIKIGTVLQLTKRVQTRIVDGKVVDIKYLYQPDTASRDSTSR
jgi:hypothetical protein